MKAPAATIGRTRVAVTRVNCIDILRHPKYASVSGNITSAYTTGRGIGRQRRFEQAPTPTPQIESVTGLEQCGEMIE
jgi:hypothetical protein